MRVAGKVIIVTGAGSGMGRELTLELLRRGARVAAADLNPEALAETATRAASFPDALATFTVNITDQAAVEALLQSVQDRFGSVDGLINCAGVIQPFVPLNELALEQIDRVFNVNFRGTLLMTKAFLPALLQRPEAHIVNISSMGGFIAFPGQTVYGASKAAVKLLTEGLHTELSDTNVRVTVVFPGAVDTKIAENSGVTMSAALQQDSGHLKPLSAKDAARDIIDGMERDAFRVLVGRDAKALDALYRLWPARATTLIAKPIKKMLHL